MKKYLVLVVFTLFAMIFIAIGCATEGNPLIGTWRAEVEHWWEEFTFYSDMTFLKSMYLGADVMTFRGTYSYTSTTLTLSGDRISVTYDYEIIGSKLYITLYEDTGVYIKQ